MTVHDRTLLTFLSGDSESLSVIKSALGLANLLGVEVEAVHVIEEGSSSEAPAAIAKEVGVRLHERRGPVADELLQALDSPLVLGAAVGTRSLMSGPRPAGSTALRVLRDTSKPTLFVPPDVLPSTVFVPERLLVPLNGSEESSNAYLDLEGDFRADAIVEVIVLHTFDGSTPVMVDRPEYDLPMWGDEFILRHCPGERRSFAWRTGNPANAVIEVSEQARSDLIVLSFGGDIDVGHGAVVREVLARSPIPVLVLRAPRNPASVDTGVHGSYPLESPVAIDATVV